MSSHTVRVRRAESRDLAEIGKLGASLVRLHHDFDPARFIAATPQTEDGYASFLGAQLLEPEIIVFVAECDDAVIGYTYAGIEGRDYMSLRDAAGVLYDIVVRPDDRGRGIGQRLLDATLAEIKTRGSPRVVLSTAQRNETAQRMFERAGFRRTMIEMTREL